MGWSRGDVRGSLQGGGGDGEEGAGMGWDKMRRCGRMRWWLGVWDGGLSSIRLDDCGRGFYSSLARPLDHSTNLWMER